ncbi:MAG: hypothetical protein ACE5GL_08200, partial [Calditrichia bacterium]
INGSVFYSYITNYITAVVNPEIDRLFMPSAEPKHVKQFINVNQAAQTGFELTGGTDFLRHFRGWGVWHIPAARTSNGISRYRKFHRWKQN